MAPQASGGNGDRMEAANVSSGNACSVANSVVHTGHRFMGLATAEVKALVKRFDRLPWKDEDRTYGLETMPAPKARDKFQSMMQELGQYVPSGEEHLEDYVDALER